MYGPCTGVGKELRTEATTEVCGIRRATGQEFGLGRTLFVFWEMGEGVDGSG